MDASTDIVLANSWSSTQATASTPISAAGSALPSTGDSMLDIALWAAVVVLAAASVIFAALAHREEKTC